MSAASPLTPAATIEQLKTNYVDQLIPQGYLVTSEGVFEERGEDDYYQITSVPVWVAAVLRTFESQNWSQEIRWRDHDGIVKTATICYEQLLNRNSYFDALVRDGLFILPGALPKFQYFLAQCIRVPSLPSVRTRRTLGLFTIERNGSPQFAFMLPDRCLMREETERENSLPRSADSESNESICFHPAMPNNAFKAYASAGSLDEWKVMIDSTRGNTLITFAVCAALAGPFLEVAGVDNVIFHFFGKTSIGKTTTLQAAASVWGCAADPERCGRTDTTLIERWNSTPNALEPIAATHSNMFLAMDELGSNGDGNLSVYNLTAGKGKSRMTDTGGLRDDHRWRLLILSTGELSMREKIEESLKRKAKEGEMNRANDIPVAELSGDSNLTPEVERELMHKLKDDFARVYGTAGPAFVQALLNSDDFRTPEEFCEELHTLIEELDGFLGSSLEERGARLGKTQRRALRRFAFVLAVGRLAVASGILPHTDTEVINAVDAVVTAWLSEQPSESEGERALQAIREYAITNARSILPFKEWQEQGCPEGLLPYNMKGIQKGDVLLLTRSQLREACGGQDERVALSYLRDAGILKREGSKMTYRVNIQELKIHRAALYAIRTDRLHAWEQSGGSNHTVVSDDESAA